MSYFVIDTRYNLEPLRYHTACVCLRHFEYKLIVCKEFWTLISMGKISDVQRFS